MEGYLLDWANLLLRWLHVITAIAWIGSSFYFVWLDNSLTRPTAPDLLEKGVDGELWAVHGGGFYHPQKYLLAPKQLPEHLHWFYWESYSTWMSGFALLTVVYLFNANVYLIDRSVFDMTATTAVLLALAFLAVGWLVYDTICRVFGRSDRLVGVLVALYVVIAAYAACHLFSGRAAFLLVGAMIATIMSANVFFWIIPGQRKVVAALKAGEKPDPIHGKRGKQRSVHNTYFTLPVLFAMLSNHYSMTYGHQSNWVVLVLIMLAGVLIRQFFILKHKGVWNMWYPVGGVALLLGSVVWLAPVQHPSAPEAPGGAAAPGGTDFAKVQAVVTARCYQCHSAHPTLMPSPAKGVLLDTPDQLAAHAQLVYQQAVQQKLMPLGNITQMTDEERTVIAKWFEGGARTAN
ncbi:urate hydroxylase PuuD [Ralstonia solanacearum]|uniref:Urate hydroxylase PuuD n=1 Tax=Ralstonia solanacearum TaxID=305 RepID=A0AAW5ZIR6_RALSL|nr:urate hydroxylase PuuD [Ralstonia solanacearum]MDB0564510.1 urate hydroxylase PuuD [Ralstonia solanacearum]MDB0569627.1 urate hydroxylase PuuD [Ralstonia solanacearum]MDB0577012.1 urate hydroxylase PuuD [Ralstonia solanacearum]OAI64196.1 membrane protein [Ralstonia solanacearum]